MKEGRVDRKRTGRPSKLSGRGDKGFINGKPTREKSQKKGQLPGGGRTLRVLPRNGS